MTRKETALRYFDQNREDFERQAEENIEKYRKGNAIIRLDGDPDLLRDATVEINQTDHAFRFGANIFMLDEFETPEKNCIYREKFPEIFNLATVPFYWSDLEPERGKPRYAKDSPRVYRRPATDLCVEYCREKGIEPKCHCLNYVNFHPDWLVGASVDEEKKALEERFSSIARRYADDIPSFEVTNETLQSLPGMKKSNFYKEDDFVEWSFKTAHKYFPNNRLIINDYRIWDPGTFNNRNYYYMQIERLLTQVEHLDSIGMQFHSFFPLRDEEKMAERVYNPATLYRLMDCYKKLGKKEQITEMTIPAYSNGAEDEEVQACLLRDVYTAFFSHPAMEAIIYWNVVDGYAAFAEQGDMTAGENTYYGGLLRFDMSEKPAFRTLRRLIREEWHTALTAPVQNGTVAFRGFYGDYEMKIKSPQGEKTVRFTLKDGEEQIRVRI